MKVKQFDEMPACYGCEDGLDDPFVITTDKETFWFCDDCWKGYKKLISALGIELTIVKQKWDNINI